MIIHAYTCGIDTLIDNRRILNMNQRNHTNHYGNCHEVILLMDLQPRLLSTIQNSNSLLNANSIFSQACNILGIPIIFTEQVPDKLGETDSSLTEALNGYKIIKKDSFSAFDSSEFSELISTSKVKNLVISGVETSICVFLTVMDALKQGLEVSVISDCVSCRRQEDGDLALRQLQHLGVRVIPLETFLFCKLKTSSHTSFREISGLIKTRT